MKNDRLVVASTITWSAGQTVEQLIEWSINERGQLLIYAQNRGIDPFQMIYRQRD